MSTTRHIIRGGIYMLLLQGAVGGIGFFVLYRNYDNITKSESIKEHYTPTIKLQNRHTAAPNNKSNVNPGANSGGVGDSIYSGMMGNVTIGSKDMGSTYQRKIISYRDININPSVHDALRMVLEQSPSLTRDQKTIIYILQQAKQNNFLQTINDLNFLSKYTNNTTATNPLSNPRDALDQSIQNQDQSYIINYLQSLESDFMTFLTKKNKKVGWDNNLLKSEKFAYVYNQLHVDSDNKYRDNIILTSKIFNLNPNLIKACIFVEQLRAFYTFKGLFKSIAQTNYYLTVMSKQSFGIGGMKLQTAEQLEQRLSSNKPEIYQQYFVYPNSDHISQQRLARLIDGKTYYYQILYTAGLLYQYSQERKKAGYDITNNPGVLATMYNIGYSKPHPNADIGGSFMKIEGEKYSFGGLAMLLYYYLEIYG